MAYSYPNQNAPGSLGQSDETKWRPARHHHRHDDHNHTSPLERFFEKKDLPMYKDKPYSYPNSGRYVPPWRQKRILVLAAFCLFLLWWSFGTSSRPKARPKVEAAPPTDIDALLEAASASEDWALRADAVRDVFKQSWDAYEKYAWGMDEFHPASKAGQQTMPKGVGRIIVDALDTLMIMNLTTRLVHAREWVATSLDFSQDAAVGTFDATARILGGLLSAHHLSTTYPDMAPLLDDDQGQAGEDLYIEKAADLANRLLGAFAVRSGLPYPGVNLANREGVWVAGEDSAGPATSEAAGLQLELRYMAQLVGETLYWEAAEATTKAVDDTLAPDGLVPTAISPDTGVPLGAHVSVGRRGAAYYETLIKQYLQTNREEPLYQALWDEALAGVRKHLVAYSELTHLTFLAERPGGIGAPLDPAMDLAACALPGAIVLGATGGLTVAQARKANRWGPRQEGELHLARELTKTCWAMHKAADSGLAPEAVRFAVDDPPLGERDGPLTSERIDWAAQGWRSDVLPADRAADRAGRQRPHAAAALFCMFRLTGDNIYRDWGWDMFRALAKAGALRDGSGAFAGVEDVREPERKTDAMESSWLAETLKYFYLLFGPADLLPLDKVVFSAAGHVFPVFPLQRELKTGWTRKSRDGDEGAAGAE